MGNTMTAAGHTHVQTPMAGLVDLALEAPTFADLVEQASNGAGERALVGPASARLFAAAALAKAGPLLVVTATGREADDLTAELRAVLGDAVAMFPSWETLPHERLSPGVETVGARMLVLRRLANPDDPRLGTPLRVVVTTTRSLLQPMAPDLADIEPVTLRVGVEADFDSVIARLVELAYTRVDMVGKRGEFAVRGGIVDVFAPTAEHPVRAEFWGDEVTELRMFSVADQRSIPELELDTLIAVPCREVLLTDDVRARAKVLADALPTGANHVTGTVGDMVAKLAEGIPVDGMEALLPVLRPGELALLHDALPDGTPLLVCDPEKVRTRAADLIKTGREFLEASWSVAAVGGDAPIDYEQLGGSGFRELDDVRSAARADGYPWWTLSQPRRRDRRRARRPWCAVRAGARRVPRRDVRDAAGARRDRRRRGGGGAGYGDRSSRRRATRRSRYARNDVGARCRAEGRCRRGAQRPTARRPDRARREPGDHHRGRSDRQPGHRAGG